MRLQTLLIKKLNLEFKEPVIDEKSGEQKNDPEKGLLWKDSPLKMAMIDEIEQSADAEIIITLNQEGKELLESVSFRSLDKPVAIELNGLIVNAPTVSDTINSGTFTITFRSKKDADSFQPCPVCCFQFFLQGISAIARAKEEITVNSFKLAADVFFPDDFLDF